MGEINFLLRKAMADKEREYREWRINSLEKSAIPHAEHELKTVKELGLEYVSVASKLEELKREYKHLTGRCYTS